MAGSSCPSELSRLHLETWAPVENKLATHQEAAAGRGDLYSRGSAKLCDSKSVVVTVLYIVLYVAFGRRADSQSSLMNKEKKR